ncbi:hypothetical protein [Pararhodobacter sp.]
MAAIGVVLLRVMRSSMAAFGAAVKPSMIHAATLGAPTARSGTPGR